MVNQFISRLSEQLEYGKPLFRHLFANLMVGSPFTRHVGHTTMSSKYLKIVDIKLNSKKIINKYK